MRTGIRPKLVVLLTVVALLPLLAALGVMLFGFGRARLGTYGQTLRAMASADAMSLEISLTKDLQRLHGVFTHNALVTECLAGATALPEETWRQLDRLWPTLRQDDPRMAGILDHPRLGPLLRQLQEEDPRIAEILVTDRYGQLVAASGKSEDFYQGDDPWWRPVYNDGRNFRIYVPPIGRDVSANVWSVDLCLPISEGGRFFGVVKVVLSVSGWLERVDRVAAQTQAAVSLLRDDGTILFIDDPEKGESTPANRKVELRPGEKLDTAAATWRRAPDGTLQAFAPIRLRKRLADHEVVCPTWLLSLQLPEKKVLAATRELTLVTLAIGLALILGVFVLGLLLAEKGLVRRIRRLQHVSHDVAAGDLSCRVPVETKRPFGRDELDDLADDFNGMIDQVAASYAALRNAHAMKTHFMQIAGHELRTPVSYILAMARLLRDCADLERLRGGVQTMAAKAHRLEEIIQAIFKLLPERRLGTALHYEGVNLSEVLESVHADCRPFVERRRQALRIECGPLPEVQADRGKLRDAVEQLTMNAIKFTPDGGTIRIRAGEQLGGYVAISVQDQGPGIPQADLPNIFEPFHGSGDVMKHSTGDVDYQKRGIGLGLAVVKHFVELHAGTVQVATGPQGSTFTIVLPIAPQAMEPADPAQEKPA